MAQPTEEDPPGFEYEVEELTADVKELTHECTVCDRPGILLSSGGQVGEFETWYCEVHVDQFLADGAFCAAITNDSEHGNKDTTEALTFAYLRRLGWSDEHIREIERRRWEGGQ